MSLKELQTRFLNGILGEDDSVLDMLAEQGELSSQQRLAIYQNGYVARLVEVIDSDFPCLGKLLGDDLFAPFVTAYIHTYPSHSPSLNDFGQFLPEFIKRYPPLASQLIASELCDFEWQLRTTFCTQNEPVLAPEYLHTIPAEEWPSQAFKTVSGLSVRYYQMNTPAIWQALKNDKQPEIKRLSVPETWIIWRQNLITQFNSLAVDEAVLLEMVQSGEDFSGLCEALLEWHEEAQVPARAFQLLQRWLSLGLLVDRSND
jgi:hypothetical protein